MQALLCKKIIMLRSTPLPVLLQKADTTISITYTNQFPEMSVAAQTSDQMHISELRRADLFSL